MARSRSSISKAESYKEIGEFWDTHDLSEHWGETAPVEFEVDARSEVTYYPVETDLSSKLRSIAERRGGSPVSFLVYVEDVDRVVEQAVAAGAKIVRPVADQFYGDRTGGVEDPFGHAWYIATHVEDVSEEETQRRAAAQHGGA